MMSRHFLQRLAVWTAFAVALLVPFLFSRSAAAAILPLCEVDAATMMPRAPTLVPLAFAAAVLEDATPPCDALSATDDDSVDPTIAAFCDARGASAVAPQRIVPITDARVEATPGCARLDTSTQKLAASPRDGDTAGSTALLLDPAAIDPAALIPPASSELLPAYAPVTDVELAGIEQAVYHPPR
jgi:hypothetical protein